MGGPVACQARARSGPSAACAIHVMKGPNAVAGFADRTSGLLSIPGDRAVLVPPPERTYRCPSGAWPASPGRLAHLAEPNTTAGIRCRSTCFPAGGPAQQPCAWRAVARFLGRTHRMAGTAGASDHPAWAGGIVRGGVIHAGRVAQGKNGHRGSCKAPARKARPLMAPSRTSGGMMPLLRGRARKVVIFQCLLALSQPG
jgi:hypothetical protein